MGVEGEAKTVAVAIQTATSNTRRETMILREKDLQSASKTLGQQHEKETSL